MKCKDCSFYDEASGWCCKKYESPDPELDRDCEWYDEPVSPDYAMCKPQVRFYTEEMTRLIEAKLWLAPTGPLTGGEKCGGCVRCHKRGYGEPGWHCTMRRYGYEIDPDQEACEEYWDRAMHDAKDAEFAEAVQRRREELWAIYSKRDPVKMLIVDGFFGRESQCPVCGEMPYSTEQCQWCGQRFIQDAETVEWGTPLTVDMVCPNESDGKRYRMCVVEQEEEEDDER